MKEVKQAATRTSLLTLLGSKIRIVVTAILPKDEGDYDVNDKNAFFLLLTASISAF